MDGQDLAGAAAAEVAQIARELGAQLVPEGADPAQLLAPAATLRVARQVELAARAEVGRQIRRAREDGLSWHEIGGLLEEHLSHCVVDAVAEGGDTAAMKVREASEAIARLVKS